MTITTNVNDNTAVFAIEGRLDTITAPSLEKEVNQIPDGVDQLVMDIEKVEYVSSAGLRVFLGAQKMMMSRNGSMIVRNVCPVIMEIFEVTGFDEILTIE